MPIREASRSSPAYSSERHSSAYGACVTVTAGHRTQDHLDQRPIGGGHGTELLVLRPRITSSALTTCSRSPNIAVAEHLHAAGFSVGPVVPPFLPYSFRGRLPASPAPTHAYLRHPFLWRLAGKPFLVLGTC